MSFKEREKEIKILFEEILYLRGKDNKQTLCAYERILQIGKQRNDNKLMGMAYYYKSEAYFFLENHQEAYKNLILSLPYLKEENMREFLAKVYNLFGVISVNQGSYAMALEQYVMALRFCEEDKIYYVSGMAYANIANIYLQINEYETAEIYLSHAIEEYQKDAGNPLCEPALLHTYALDVYCNSKMQRFEKAAELNKKLKQIFNRKAEGNKRVPVYFYMAWFAYESGKEQLCLENIKKAMEKLEQWSVLQYFQDFIIFLKLLLELKRYEEFCQLSKYLEQKLGISDIPNLQLHLLELELYYFDIKKDRENYQKKTEEFYQVYQKQRKENQKMILNTLDMHFAMEQIRKEQQKMEIENAILLRKSEQDYLTGLVNREKLNNHMEELLERAKKEKTSIGLALIDIDYFKEYNDSYGHLAGDSCIKIVAEAIHSIENDSILCARYGGDEFVIVFDGKTDEEILDYVKQVAAYLENCNMEHKASTVSDRVTISQGIRNSIPNETNRVWDYFGAADSALYDVKREKRGGVLLVHSTHYKE